MEILIYPHGRSFDDVPSVIFCEVDPPPDFINLVQKVSDDVGLVYALVRKNASPAEYRQFVLDKYPVHITFLVYDGSSNFMCYGIEEDQLDGIKMTVRSLRRYSLDRAYFYETYVDYMFLYEQNAGAPVNF